MKSGEIYSGVNAMLHLRFYSYRGGSGGVNAQLIGVMKTGDNEKLGHTDPDSSAAFTAATGGAVQPQQVQQQPVQQQQPEQQPAATSFM